MHALHRPSRAAVRLAAALSERWAFKAPGARSKPASIEALVAELSDRDPRALEQFVAAVERADRALKRLRGRWAAVRLPRRYDFAASDRRLVGW